MVNVYCSPNSAISHCIILSVVIHLIVCFTQLANCSQEQDNTMWKAGKSSLIGYYAWQYTSRKIVLQIMKMFSTFILTLFQTLNELLFIEMNTWIYSHELLLYLNNFCIHIFFIYWWKSSVVSQKLNLLSKRVLLCVMHKISFT